jgi:hypothetical protein
MLGQDGQRGGHAGSNDGMDCAFLWLTTPAPACVSRGEAGAVRGGARRRRRARHRRRAHGRGLRRHAGRLLWHNRRLDPAGSLLFLTTDGLIDQIGGARDIAYGKRRMRELLLAQRDAPAGHVAAALLRDSQPGKAGSRAATT